MEKTKLVAALNWARTHKFGLLFAVGFPVLNIWAKWAYHKSVYEEGDTKLMMLCAANKHEI